MDNAGWACNELGRHYVEGRLVAADADRAAGYFTRACEAPLPGRVRQPARCDHPGARPIPRLLDLRLLLREGGPNLLDMPEPDLYARACRHGWSFACGKTVAVAVTARLVRWRRLGAAAILAAAVLAMSSARPRRSARRPPTSGCPADPLARLRRDPGRPGRDGCRRAAQAFDNERWSATRGGGHGGRRRVPARAARGHGGAVCRLRRGGGLAQRAARAGRRRRSPGDLRLVDRRAGLLPLARGGAEGVADDAAGDRHAARRRLARHAADRGAVGEGGPRRRSPAVPVGRRRRGATAPTSRARRRRRSAVSPVPSARTASTT